MKTITLSTLLLCTSVSLFSCQKEVGASLQDNQKAEEFKAFVASKQFQLKEYYSDQPIDYIEDDAEVKAETNLWPYVSLWIKDDFNVIDVNSGKVTISQNANKFTGISSEVFSKDILIGADKDGPYFTFVNYQYNSLKYRLVDFDSERFTVYVDWHSGAKVFSKFKVMP